MGIDSRFFIKFWEKVLNADGDGCWLWLGKVKSGSHPYGRVARNGKQVMAHRVSWEMRYGAIPDGLFALHHCDNPRCVRPSHLFIGTQKDNSADAISKGRKAYPVPPSGSTHHNAKLNEESVRAIFRRVHAGERQRAIATEFGVGQDIVSRISTAQTWKAVTAPLLAEVCHRD